MKTEEREITTKVGDYTHHAIIEVEQFSSIPDAINHLGCDRVLIYINFFHSDLKRNIARKKLRAKARGVKTP